MYNYAIDQEPLSWSLVSTFLLFTRRAIGRWQILSLFILQGTYVTKNKNSPRDVQLFCQNSAFRRFVSSTISVISPNFGPFDIVVVWKRKIFSPSWPTVHTCTRDPVKTVPEKRWCSMTLSRVEIFENTVLLYSCTWMETKVFESDYVMVLVQPPHIYDHIS